ncbi:hypothetical protein [Pontiella sp.]|uniref:hypothetical protein n=1 Tax=Pontiella sp. TaxID=2837462 RepID=UPI003563145B
MCLQPEFANYSVKTTGWTDEHWNWCESRGMAFRVFVNSDGGGYNHHTVEFQALELARAFLEHFGISGPRRLYAEDREGKIHYLESTPKPGREGAMSEYTQPQFEEVLGRFRADPGAGLAGPFVHSAPRGNMHRGPFKECAWSVGKDTVLKKTWTPDCGWRFFMRGATGGSDA